MGCNQSNENEGQNPYPPSSTWSYQITFLPEHEIIGEFGQKIITNPLNSSSSEMYKKEMEHNVPVSRLLGSCFLHLQLFTKATNSLQTRKNLIRSSGMKCKALR